MLSNLSLSQLVKIVHGQLQNNTAAALDDDMIHGVRAPTAVTLKPVICTYH